MAPGRAILPNAALRAATSSKCTAPLPKAATVSRHKKNEVHEAADVMYHILVFLEANNVKVEDVMNELKKREGVSGLVEKASRKS